MSPGVVRRVDHVNVRTTDPRPLFSVLSERLGLPVVWPVTRFPGFEIGSVTLGNMTVEPTNYTPGGSERSSACRLFSICLEPEPVEAAVEELAQRGISHSPPVPYLGAWPKRASTDLFHPEDPTSRRQRLWTWVFLGGFLGDRRMARQWSNPLFRSDRVARAIGRAAGSPRLGGMLASSMAPRLPYPFFCQWDGFDIDAFRERARSELKARDGGPLGIEGVREIVVSAKDLDRESARWRKLLAPAPETEPSRWELGDGPAVRLIAGDTNAIASLVLEVTSLEGARSFLDAEGMLGAASEGEVRIAPEAMFGLDLRLVAAQR